MSANYRKIYEYHYGKIPRDKEGRSYEIHHIDGDHSNNSSKNLTAVSIQEHYDIHYNRGDYAACLRIASRMKLSTVKLSELSRKSALLRVAAGNHPFQTRPDGTNLQTDRINNGTHNFLDGKIQKQTQIRRIEDGSHPFQTRPDGTNLQTDRINNETHHFLTRFDGSSLSSDRVANGTHHFLGENNPSHNRVANGTHHFLTNHPSKNWVEVKCPYCPITGKGSNMKRYHFDNCKSKQQIILLIEENNHV